MERCKNEGKNRNIPSYRSMQQGVKRGIQLADIFDAEQGGMHMAFDYKDTLSRITPHRIRVFVFVYHDPLC